MSAETFRRSGIYFRRLELWFPWGVTDWWRPRFFWGGNEWCDVPACFVVPPLGCLVLYKLWGRLRTMPCPEDWRTLNDGERADYAPCGRLHAGRWRDGGHAHSDTGICEEAAEWLKTAKPA